ncbi:MAG: sigma-54 dependent transcriptional regulator [Bacteroidota bacterium]
MKNKPQRILILDDDPDVLLAAQFLLKQNSYVVRTESDPGVISTVLKEESFDVILLDMNFTRDVSSGKEGFYWLDRILEIDPSSVVILITAYGDVEMAVKAIKAGATDFILKPWQNEKLLATLSAALALKDSRNEIEHLLSRQQQMQSDLDRGFQGFVGTSRLMLDVFETIKKVAGTDANVLILGENGTGKELVARELHRQSARNSNVFISVDMGALHSGLFESELFGHVKGAFTDAREHRAGRFEVASGGTLFLDEIGNLPFALQSKLLTVLQNREVTRLGSNKTIPFDIRLICASNMPLHTMVAHKEFRDDLFYRIQTVEIQIPPLRSRHGDIPLLVEYFLEMYCSKYGKPLKQVAPSSMKQLEQYQWPGNVRELQHAVERAVIMTEAAVLQPADFLLSAHRPVSAPSPNARLNLDDLEKTAIQKALSKHDGNITHAARDLGLTRAALYRRLEKYGL